MISYFVEVLLNRTEDEDGRLAIFSRGDALEQVWSGTVTVDEPNEDVLNLTYEMFNRGAPRFVGDDAYPQRSLSIGDVIRLDECDRYVVENVGFKKL